MRARWFLASVALLGLMAASHEARAVVVTPLPPGSANAPIANSDADKPTGTLLDFREHEYNVAIGTTRFHVSVRQEVIREADGFLTFLYQVANFDDSTVPARRITTSDFKFVDIQTAPRFGAGWFTTAPTYAGTGFENTTLPTVNPFASRPNVPGNPDGFVDEINFQRSEVGGLDPGSVGNILFLRTNATAYTIGTMSVADGGASTGLLEALVPGPSAVIPEPGTAMLSLVAGLPLLGGYWVRRRRASQA